ncbi:MAG: CoA transferase [Acidimicrobiales bacterium]
MSEPGAAPLDGLRVIDLATVLAGPNCARYLADFGADVIKVEHPDGGDTLRRMAWLDPDDGTSLFFKLANRNKRFVTLDLRHADDLAVLRRLLAEADVLVENLRPGKLEALGLAPDDLLAANDRLVITRVTGFGQDGPYAHRAGFATLAEAMSGFAAVNGEPDGAPMLPPIALTDELTAIVAAFATMVAVHSGVGQVVDVNLLESMLHIMGPVVSAYDRLGYVQPRLGSGIPTPCRATPTAPPTGTGWPSRRRPSRWRHGSSPWSAPATTSASPRSPVGSSIAPRSTPSWRRGSPSAPGTRCSPPSTPSRPPPRLSMTCPRSSPTRTWISARPWRASTAC